MFEIVPHGTRIDFIGKRRIAFAVSAVVLLAGLAAGVFGGVKLGIDFAGGTEVLVAFEPGVEAGGGPIRTVVTACGVQDPSVVRYGEEGSGEFLIRFRSSQDAGGEGGTECPLSPEERERLARVAQATGAEADGGGTGGGAVVDRLTLALSRAVGPLDILRVEYVGPRVGDELREDGALAMGIAILLILAYITFRFSSRFAPGAVVALLHDVAITSGILVILGVEFDLRVLAALLAILGYSLNDTIIIYDRIRENMELRTKHDLLDVLNRSVNQTLSRSLLTSSSTLAAVLCLLVVGGEVIRPFALAMAIGIVVGTYSSVFVAAPTLLFLEQRLGDGTGSGQTKPGGREAKSKTRAA